MKYIVIALVAFMQSCALRPKPSNRPIDSITWVKVCWTEDGFPLYPMNDDQVSTACDNPEEIRWDQSQFPIRVKINDRVKQAGYDDEVRYAIQKWNLIAGRELFQETQVTADLYVDFSMSFADTALAATMHIKEAGHTSAFVVIFPSVMFLSDDQANATLLHEFGHVLGLGHDQLKTSLMYPVIAMTFKQYLTPEDCAAIRNRYGIRRPLDLTLSENELDCVHEHCDLPSADNQSESDRR